MFRNLLESRLFAVGLVAIAGFFLLSIIRLQPVLVSTRKEIRNIEQKNAELERARRETERLGDYLNSPAYLERQARIWLNYKEPGEKVVYVYDQTAETNEAAGGRKQNIADGILKIPFFKNLKSWWGYVAE